jgi:hypothetical protein
MQILTTDPPATLAANQQYAGIIAAYSRDGFNLLPVLHQQMAFTNHISLLA